MSFRAYHQAFLRDLNHAYPGLAALQMASLAIHLADGDPQGWNELFEDDDEAIRYRRDLGDMRNALVHNVATSAEAELMRCGPDDPARLWTEIINADVLFLANPARTDRIVNAYAKAIPPHKAFAWDAARGQLALYAELDFHAEQARAVIEKLDAHVGPARRA